MAYDFYLNGRGFTSRTITVYRDSGRWRAKNDKARQFIPPSDAFSASSPQGEPDRSVNYEISLAFCKLVSYDLVNRNLLIYKGGIPCLSEETMNCSS